MEDEIPFRDGPFSGAMVVQGGLWKIQMGMGVCSESIHEMLNITGYTLVYHNQNRCFVLRNMSFMVVPSIGEVILTARFPHRSIYAQRPELAADSEARLRERSTSKMDKYPTMVQWSHVLPGCQHFLQ